MRAQTGKNATPWIGVGMALEGAAHGGVVIREAMPGSPGQRAGIKAGEEITHFDDDAVRSPADLVAKVKAAGVGHEATLRLFSTDGTMRTVKLKLDPKPDQVELQRRDLLGQAAPDFALEARSGPKLGKISALRGKVVVLDFFATWCGPCMRALPRLKAMAQRLEKRGVRVIGVSGEAPEVVSEAATRFGIEYSLVQDADEKLASRYRVFALPTLVVIGKNGKVRDIVVADIDEGERAIEAAVKAK